MSTRRKPGEVVRKRENAGFSGHAGIGVIPEGSEPDECMLGCGDRDCKEWPDLWPCDENGKPTGGNWCHVSECEMSDAPTTPNIEVQGREAALAPRSVPLERPVGRKEE